MSVRNLGLPRNAGSSCEVLRGHPGAAGAIARWQRPWVRCAGSVTSTQPAGRRVHRKVLALALEFLHEHQPAEKRLVAKALVRRRGLIRSAGYEPT